MVANNMTKFLDIILSELFIQRTLDGVASAGVVAVMFFGCLYAQSWQGLVAKTKTATHTTQRDVHQNLLSGCSASRP